MINKIIILCITALLSITASAYTQYGSELFAGNFKDTSIHSNNQNYVLVPGDKIQIHLWGALSLDIEQTIDEQGNIFLPDIGQIKVSGVKNKDLTASLKSAISSTYTDSVKIYANLITFSDIKIFVSGKVNKPGLYSGSSSDSILKYIDMAGGINTAGSFTNIQIKRNNRVVGTVDLYGFLNQGFLPEIQLRDGDSIHIPNFTSIAFISIDSTKYSIQFKSKSTTLKNIISKIPLPPSITSARITSNTNDFNYQTKQDLLRNLLDTEIKSGDKIKFISENSNNSIAITINGAHTSNENHIISKGTTLNKILSTISLTATADTNSIQLFRQSVKKSQKALLEDAANKLKRIALTTQSQLEDVAKLRTSESKLLVDFAEKTAQIEPSGQIIVQNSDEWSNITLVEGDIITIPEKNNLISVAGEVMFPSTFSYNNKTNLHDYINLSGGLTSLANSDSIIIKHQNGLITNASLDDNMAAFSNKNCSFLSSCDSKSLVPGDIVMILPKIEDKTWAHASTVMKIVYQIAVSASVVLGL